MNGLLADWIDILFGFSSSKPASCWGIQAIIKATRTPGAYDENKDLWQNPEKKAARRENRGLAAKSNR
jgi:hypothetical protein